jgi:hypothetical protein
MNGKTVVAGYIWVFVVIAVGLTTLTVCAWYVATHRARKKEAARRDLLTSGLSLNGIP